MTSPFLDLPRRSLAQASADRAAGIDSRRVQDLPPPQMTCARCGEKDWPRWDGICLLCRAEYS